MKMHKKIIVFLFILLMVPFSCFALDVAPSIASGEENGNSQLVNSNNYKNIGEIPTTWQYEGSFNDDVGQATY